MFEEKFSEIVVMPTVTYGGESSGTKNYKRNKLNLMEMKCLQSMDRVTEMCRVRNKEVKCRFEARRNVSDGVDRKVLKWFSHMKHKNDNGVNESVHESKLEDRRAAVGLVRAGKTVSKRHAVQGR